MNILFVSSGNSIRGISPIVKNQGESLKKQGIKLDYFTIKGKGFSGYIKNIPILRKHVKNSNYDIIHAHYGLCGIVVWLLKLKNKIVISFMGDDLIGSVNKKGNYSVKSKIFSILNKLVSSYFYNYVILKSDIFLNKLNLKDNFSIIPNGVNFEKFKSVDKNTAKKMLHLDINKNYILFASNPNRYEKNYSLANKSFDIVKKKDMELITIFNVSQVVLNLYYSATDLIVLTSLHEGSPNVVKEAMACNCPIVSTDVGDVNWLLGDIPGHFICSFDPEDVAEKIKMALEFKQKFGRTNGRQRIIDLGLDSETIAKKIINVYKKVIS